MKIDFHAPYGALERILRNPERLDQASSSKPGNFEKLLADIAPNSSKHTRLIDNSSGPLGKGSAEVHASLSSYPSIQAKLIPSDLEELYPSQPSEKNVESGPSGSVKSPTLLKLKRLEPEAPMIPASPTVENKLEGSLKPTESPILELPSSINMDEIRASVRRSPLVPFHEIERIVNTSGKVNGIDPALGLAVIEAESGFDPRAVSKDGHASKGLMQLLDTTGKEILEHLGESNSQYNPFDPEQNVQLGVRYLRRLHDYFGEETKLNNGQHTRAAANISSLERLAVAAFNAGEGRVAYGQRQAEKAGLNPSEYKNVESYLPASTQQYVKKVMSYRELHASRIDPEQKINGEG